MSSKPARTLVTIVMDILVVLAVLVTAAVVVAFFGQLASQHWGKTILALSKPLIIPFGIAPIKTPYGGVFAINAALTVLVLLGIEWILSGIRSRV